MSAQPEPEWLCDIVHFDVAPDGTATVATRPADWVLIGEAGDFAVCDEHHQAMRDPSPQWRQVAKVAS